MYYIEFKDKVTCQ